MPTQQQVRHRPSFLGSARTTHTYTTPSHCWWESAPAAKCGTRNFGGGGNARLRWQHSLRYSVLGVSAGISSLGFFLERLLLDFKVFSSAAPLQRIGSNRADVAPQHAGAGGAPPHHFFCRARCTAAPRYFCRAAPANGASHFCPLLHNPPLFFGSSARSGLPFFPPALAHGPPHFVARRRAAPHDARDKPTFAPI